MWSELASDFKEFRTGLGNWLFYRRHAMKMSLAIALADMKQRAFNRRFHVMLMELPGGKNRLVSISRQEILNLKRKKWLPKDAGLLELQHSIFYSTPLNRNNTSTPKDRKAARKKYIKYAKKYMR